MRTSEAVLDAYLALRNGNVARGMARLALLLAAMEQSVLDEGKWNLRAATLLGMPPAPVHNYRAATAEQKPSGNNKLGKTNADKPNSISATAIVSFFPSLISPRLIF